MAPQKTGIINVVNSGFQNLGFYNSPYMSAMFNGIGSILQEQGYKMLFQIFKDSGGRLHAAEITKGQQADGIIFILFAVNLKFLMGEILPFLKTTGVPFVMIHSFDCPVGCPSVGLDSMQGGYLGTEHLIKHGYDSIGFIVHHEAHHNVNALEGYRKAHHQFVMPVQEKYIIPGKGWTIEGGWQIVGKIYYSHKD